MSSALGNMSTMVNPDRTYNDNPAPTAPSAEEARRMAEFLPISDAAKVPGVCYSVPLAHARELGWASADVPVGGRSGEYLLVDEIAPGEHKLLEVKRPSPIFYANDALLLGNLDIALTRAFPSDIELVNEWAAKKWTEIPGTFGPLQERINAALTALKAQANYAALPQQTKNVQEFVCVLRVTDTELAPKVPLLWLGSPSIAEQVLVAIQRSAKDKFPDANFQLPPMTEMVTIIARLSGIVDDIRDIIRMIMNEIAVPAGTLRQVKTQVRGVRASASMLASLTWSQLCQIVQCENIDELISQIEESEEAEAPAPSGGGRQSDPRLNAATPVVINVPKEGSHALTEQELAEFNSILATGSTKDIPLEKAGLLIRAASTHAEALQPGGRDLSKIAIPQSLKSFINSTYTALRSEHSVRKFPEVALFKIVTLQWAETDNVGFEFFGKLMFVDSDEVAPGWHSVPTVNGKIMVQKARNDIWNKVTDPHHLDDIAHGFAMVVERIFHPSIISRESIWRLLSKLRQNNEENGDIVCVSSLFRAFRIRLAEHAASVRAAVAKNDFTDPLPPLDVLDNNSNIVLQSAITHARNLCHTQAPRPSSGGGETAAGAREVHATGISAWSSTLAYDRVRGIPLIPGSKRKKNPQHDGEDYDDSYRSGQYGNDGGYGGGRGGYGSRGGGYRGSGSRARGSFNPRGGRSRGMPPGRRGRTSSPCFKCIKWGHRAADCRSKVFVPIPSWWAEDTKAMATYVREALMHEENQGSATPQETQPSGGQPAADTTPPTRKAPKTQR